MELELGISYSEARDKGYKNLEILGVEPGIVGPNPGDTLG